MLGGIGGGRLMLGGIGGSGGGGAAIRALSLSIFGVRVHNDYDLEVDEKRKE